MSGNFQAFFQVSRSTQGGYFASFNVQLHLSRIMMYDATRVTDRQTMNPLHLTFFIQGTNRQIINDNYFRRDYCAFTEFNHSISGTCG